MTPVLRVDVCDVLYVSFYGADLSYDQDDLSCVTDFIGRGRGLLHVFSCNFYLSFWKV